MEQEINVNLDDEMKPHECPLFSVEMIYFLNNWHHATIDLDRYYTVFSKGTTPIFVVRPRVAIIAATRTICYKFRNIQYAWKSCGGDFHWCRL